MVLWLSEFLFFSIGLTIITMRSFPWDTNRILGLNGETPCHYRKYVQWCHGHSRTLGAEGFRLKCQVQLGFLRSFCLGVVSFFDVFPFSLSFNQISIGTLGAFRHLLFATFFSGAYSFIGLLQGKWHPCSSLWLNVLWSLSRLSVETSENPLVYTLELLSNWSRQVR